MAMAMARSVARWALACAATGAACPVGCAPNAESADRVGRADAYCYSQGADRVVIRGTFNDADIYEVLGPPMDKSYYTGMPDNGGLCFLVDLPYGVYTFTVNNVSAGHQAGTVLVSLGPMSAPDLRDVDPWGKHSGSQLHGH